MTKNQKIAIGCGSVGCLGLIILIVAGAAGYYFYAQRAIIKDESDVDVSSNSNSNSDDSFETNSNVSRDVPTPSVSSSDRSSSMSDDDKHRLFQAGATSGDQNLMAQVMKKIGLFEAPTADNEKFMKEHIVWVFKNGDFLKEIDTPEKARAYVEARI